MTGYAHPPTRTPTAIFAGRAPPALKRKEQTTSLYKITGNDLVQVRRSALTNEAMLQGWIAKDPSIVGLDALVIGREITIESGGRIDIFSEYDASSERIVKYLANEHGVAINTTFFNIFEENGEKLLTTDWLMDQQQVVERAESKRKVPWTGYYYVNAGHDTDVRNWEDMREFGFIAAGYARFFI